MTTIMFGLILSGLVCLGAVQSVRYIRKGYRRATVWFGRLAEAMRTMDAEPIEPLLPKPQGETTTRATEEGQSDPLNQLGRPNEGQYALSESVTSEDLAQLSRTVSLQTAPIEQEIAAAKTAAKISNTPLLDAFLGATGSRVKDMFSNVATHLATQPIKEFDYTRYITK